MKRSPVLLIPMIAVLPLVQAGCGDDSSDSAPDNANVDDTGSESTPDAAAGADAGDPEGDAGEDYADAEGDETTEVDAGEVDEEYDYYEYLEDYYDWPPARPPASRDVITAEAVRGYCELMIGCYEDFYFDDVEECAGYAYENVVMMLEEAEAQGEPCYQSTINLLACSLDTTSCGIDCGRESYRESQDCADPIEAPPTTYTCSVTMTEIPIEQLCDGTPHCPMGDDENMMTCMGRRP